MKKKYYAVRAGKKLGIFDNWEECKKQVTGFSNSEYKGFETLEEAQNYLNFENTVSQTISEAVAYVDGSFLKEKSMFSYGAVLFYDDKEFQFYESFSDPELVGMRNVAGEIKGAEFIMRYCIDHGIKSIDLYYDYEGIEKWCTGEWKTNKYGTMMYREFYKKASQKLSVNFIKVKGHSGNKYNDLADSLAKKALGII